MTRLALVVAVAALLSSTAFAGKTVRVKSYVTKKGTYVAPSHRTAPDRSTTNNWSTRGNANPYTGKTGSQAPGRRRR